MSKRNRFMAANFDQAIERLEIQANRALELCTEVKNFPWLYTNAGVTAEAAAHWALTAYPELRVDDDGVSA